MGFIAFPTRLSKYVTNILQQPPLPHEHSLENEQRWPVGIIFLSPFVLLIWCHSVSGSSPSLYVAPALHPWSASPSPHLLISDSLSSRLLVSVARLHVLSPTCFDLILPQNMTACPVPDYEIAWAFCTFAWK